MGKHTDPKGDANTPKGDPYHGKHRAEDTAYEGWSAGNTDDSQRGRGEGTGEVRS